MRTEGQKTADDLIANDPTLAELRREYINAALAGRLTKECSAEAAAGYIVRVVNGIIERTEQ